MNISHYFPSTKAEYIKQFFEKTFNVRSDVLDLLVNKLTTLNGYLPTGLPTSTILIIVAVL